jgi:tRNA (guanine-N7-)-methyltransferase
MPGKKKLARFAQMKEFPNTIEPALREIKNEGEPNFKSHYLKGKWHEEVYENKNPLVLELGCGKGEYSVGLGRKFPDKNFLGVDIKGARIWRGAKTALDENLKNVAFLRTRIDFIDLFFEKGEVDEIWITFPDPQLKERRERKRLTGKMFTDRYKRFLKKGGLVHLKTDNTPLYEYTLEQIKEHGFKLLFETDDLYGKGMESFDESVQEILSIKTHYEGIFSEKGFKIKYIIFQLEE